MDTVMGISPAMSSNFLRFGLKSSVAGSQRNKAINEAYTMTFQLIALGGIFIIVTVPVFGNIAWLAGAIGQRSVNPKASS